MDFGSNSELPVMGEEAEGFPESEYSGTLESVRNLLLCGCPTSTRPEGIMSPLRRPMTRKIVDQFPCTNRHAYQQGRIHSMCSDEGSCMYIPLGHFATPDPSSQPVLYARLIDMRFRVSRIPWMNENNGAGESPVETLTSTYKRYGLKPYICSTSVSDLCLHNRSLTIHNRPYDIY